MYLDPDTTYGLVVGTSGQGTDDLLINNKSKFAGDVQFETNVNVDGTLSSTSATISGGTINNSSIVTDDLEVGDNVLSAKTGGGVAIGREDARSSLDVDGEARFKTYYEQSIPLTSVSGVVTVDLSQGASFTLTPTENITRFTISNVPGDSSSSSTFTILIKQGSTPYTVDINDFRNVSGTVVPVSWNGNVLPVVTNQANSEDVYSFFTFGGGSEYYGVVAGQNFGDTGSTPSTENGLSYNPATETVGVTKNLAVTDDVTVGGDISSASDIRLKHNIQSVEGSLNILNEIRGVSFNWNSDDKKSLGVVAQDIEKVLPELIDSTEDGMKTVNYNGLIGVLIEAVKELSKRVEELENK